LMGKDGKEKQLTSDADACESTFSPDGKTIAYVSIPSGGEPQILTMNADGSNQKALYPGDPGTMAQLMPQFSPDGKSLVFYIEALSPGFIQPAYSKERSHRFFWPSAKSWHSNYIHSNGATVAAAAPSESGWYRMALTDSAATLVYSASDWWGPSAFSEDGKKLLMTVYDSDTEYLNVASVNLDGTGLTALTASDMDDTDDLAPAAYSGAILFNRYNYDNSSLDIYVMDQNGANQTLVSSETDTYQCLNDTYCSLD